MSEHWEHYNNTKKPIIQIIMHANKNSGIAPKHEVNIIGFPKDFLSRDEFSLDKILILDILRLTKKVVTCAH